MKAKGTLYRILLLSIALLSFSYRAVAQRDTTSLDLRGMAAFRPGDDLVWMSKYVSEEKGWNFIPTPGAWENHGYPLLDGFGWYRIRFTLPKSMLGDSLMLVVSGIDDADETYLNGRLIGKSGAMPPDAKSELRSLRIYPLPRKLQERYNLLAIRVFDMGDQGGITGNVIRIISVDSLSYLLDQLVDEPLRKPHLYISNGVAVSAYDPAAATIDWCKPHLFNELDPGLTTPTILSSLTLTVAMDGYVKRLSEYQIERTEYYQQSGIVHTLFKGGFEVYWYHPLSTKLRVLVVMLTHPKQLEIEDVGAVFTVSQNYWQFRDVIQTVGNEQRHYFIFVYNSCCEELAVRDMKAFLGERIADDPTDPFSLEREVLTWRLMQTRQMDPPSSLNQAENFVYRQSVATLFQAQVRTEGSGDGQIVSAFEPGSRAHTSPREHLSAAMAMAEAGLVEESAKALRFLRNAPVGHYTFFNINGESFGVGYEYKITPARYFGSGTEYVWANRDMTRLTFDGMAYYIEAVKTLQDATRRLFEAKNAEFNEKEFVGYYWRDLSVLVADPLMRMMDERGLIPHDGGPWGAGLEKDAGIYSSIHAAAALRTASDYAKLMGDDLRAFLYLDAAQRTTRTIDSIILSTSSQIEGGALALIEKNLFHPLLCDGVTLGIFRPASRQTAFALGMMESSFRIEGQPCLFNAQPEGDWTARQARPLLTLRLARACIANGDIERAEELFACITELAAANNGLLPELIDPATGNWYGGIPAVGEGAAEYILTAHAIAQARFVGDRR